MTIINCRHSTRHDANAEAAERIRTLCANDAYFRDGNLVENAIQTLGFMEYNRSTLEMLETVEKVRGLASSLFFFCVLCLRLSLTSLIFP